MSLLDLYKDYGISIAPEGNRHQREGWLNISCPHCTGNPGHHLGFNLGERYYYCFRCGHHRIDYTLSKLLNVSISEARKLARDYKLFNRQQGRSRYRTNQVNIHPFKWPSGTGSLNKAHKKYLTKRGYDPDWLWDKFGLMGTGPVSLLYDPDTKKTIDYRYRIVAPIWWDGQLVSFQSRDYTDRQTLKYITCPKKREVVHHKNILYGLQQDWKETALAVEGITDVWRFGGHSVFGTFGISYTPEQVRVISRLFKRVIVVFDPDPQAQAQGHKLAGELRFRGVDADCLGLDKDPGEMKQSEANELIKELDMKSYYF